MLRIAASSWAPAVAGRAACRAPSPATRCSLAPAEIALTVVARASTTMHCSIGGGPRRQGRGRGCRRVSSATTLEVIQPICRCTVALSMSLTYRFAVRAVLIAVVLEGDQFVPAHVEVGDVGPVVTGIWVSRRGTGVDHHSRSHVSFGDCAPPSMRSMAVRNRGYPVRPCIAAQRNVFGPTVARESVEMGHGHIPGQVVPEIEAVALRRGRAAAEHVVRSRPTRSALIVAG